VGSPRLVLVREPDQLGVEPLEGDIEFACSLFDGPKVFIMDNAADREPVLVVALQRIKETKQHACILAGERLNEWRQRSPRLAARQHVIEPLSDGEIDRLLACLEEQRELGQLENLPPDVRRAIIKEAHSKELLVAMREATEAKPLMPLSRMSISALGMKQHPTSTPQFVPSIG
jgi:hypothetical protein